MADGNRHTIKRGETIIQLANQNGFRAWEPIWMHENNASLRSERENPHVLAPGDVLFIPAMVPLDHSCETNLKHTFRVPSLTQYLQQTLLDPNHVPMPGLRYELTAGGRTFPGRTGSDGSLKEEIPLSVKTAELKVWMLDGDEDSAVQWKLDIGHLEPVDTTYGLKARLNNLGYDCGEVNDQFDDKTKGALLIFQADKGLPTTGELDQATQDMLLNAHDRELDS